MFERSEDEVREFGARPTGIPASTQAPLHIDLFSTRGHTTTLPASTIPQAFAAANATLEGAATDPDTGELFAWGADRSGNDIILIATPSKALADTNHDASISTDDALRFLELFGSAHPDSDLDSNGVINASDLQLFLDDFLRAR